MKNAFAKKKVWNFSNYKREQKLSLKICKS